MRKILSSLVFGCLLVLLLAALLMGTDVVNPHVDPESCLSCHTQIPTAEQAAAGDYYCIEVTIDATCGTCHPTFTEGPPNHPSDIDDWDHDYVSIPSSLPLFNGKITCNTCHLHLVSDALSIYLLRKVKLNDQSEFDWTELCLDCHHGY
ncbi:MAG: hypothetical protein OEL66_04725 [Desulfobulbaceae bacterium]|nr:hypothetical protein [Desulfobulbaceae bacterium]